MKDVNIKDFQIEDYNNVIKLWQDAGLILTLSDNKEELLRILENPHNKFMLFEVNDELIGSVICAFDGRRGYIHHVAVKSSLQNQGYGKFIMKKVDEYYNSIGSVKVHLMVELSNKKVVEYYKKLDWVIRDDLVLMTKTLKRGEFMNS